MWIITSRNFLSCHCVPSWNLAWGPLIFHVSKDNICFLFVFDLKKQKQQREKDFYQSRSDKRNPIMRIKSPSTFRYFIKRKRHVSVTHMQQARGSRSDWAWNGRVTAPGTGQPGRVFKGNQGGAEGEGRSPVTSGPAEVSHDPHPHPQHLWWATPTAP